MCRLPMLEYDDREETLHSKCDSTLITPGACVVCCELTHSHTIHRLPHRLPVCLPTSKDPVPHLGPEWIGFRHTDTEVFYNENSSWHKVCDGTGEDPSCSLNQSLAVCLLHSLDHVSYLNRPTGGQTCNDV